MFQPKQIEKAKDLECRENHSKAADFVILDLKLNQKDRLICKDCRQKLIVNDKMTDFNQLQKIFDENQRGIIQQYGSIMNSQLTSISSIRNVLTNLKSFIIQKIDNIIYLSEDWIQTLIAKVSQYSFFDQLSNFIKNKQSTLDEKVIISYLNRMNIDMTSKFKSQIEQLQNPHQIKLLQDLFASHQKLTVDQINDMPQPILENQRQIDFNQEETCETYEGIYWDYLYNPPRKMQRKFNIIFTKNKEVKYTFEDDTIIRIDQIRDSSKLPDTLKNLEQIQFLQWIGLYNINNLKTGKWIATWKGEILETVGGSYSREGKKHGLWKELFKIIKRETYELGEYMNNEKIGTWKYIFAEKVIGGGKYQNGKKNGNWTELSDNFFSFNQVTICGEYRFDKKVGKWEIYSRKDRFTQFSKLGGGEYNNDGFKNGNWIELSEDFCEDIFFQNEVIYEGNYVNDKKKGVWKELKRANLNDGFQKVKKYIIQISKREIKSEIDSMFLFYIQNFRRHKLLNYFLNFISTNLSINKQ